MNNNIKNIALLAVGLIFWACGNDEQPEGYKGYNKLEEGIFYKVLSKSDEVALPTEEDLIAFHIEIFNREVPLSSTYNEGEHREKIITEVEKTPLQKALRMMSEGDSLSLLVLVDSLSVIPENFKSGDWMEMRIKALEIVRKEQRLATTQTILGGLEKHPTAPFFWQQHRSTTGKMLQKGDKAFCNFSLRKGDKILHETGNVPILVEIPTDDNFISPLHLVLQTMSVGDSVTAAFEISKLSADMQASMAQNGFFEGDVLLMEVGVLRAEF